MSKDDIDYYKSRGAKENRDVDAIFSYLKEEFNSNVVYGKEGNDAYFKNLKSAKYAVAVGWEISRFNRAIGAVGNYQMKIVFHFYDGKELDYNFSVNVNGYTYDLANAIIRGLKRGVDKEEVIQKINSIVVNTNTEIIDKDSIENWKSKLDLNANSIFGMYKLISSSNFSPFDKIAVYQKEDKIYILNIENSAYEDDYKYGQIIMKIEKTASPKYFVGKSSNGADISVLYNDNLLEINYTKDGRNRKYIKIN